MKTAIIVGGAGFIGGHLTKSFLADGWQVEIADLVAPVHGQEGVRFHCVDVRSPIDAASLPMDPDLVINLAAIHREPGHADAEYFETNVGGGDHVLGLCERLRATSLIFTSSISVYGTNESVVGDGHPRDHVTPYGESKAHAEDLCLKWGAEDPGRTVSIVRPTAIFGPGEGGNFTRLARALRLGRFAFPGRRDTIKGCGYVDDLVRAMRFMHGRERRLVYNFGFPRGHSLEEICEQLCLVGSFRPPRGTFPIRLMHAAGRMGDVITPLGRSTGLSRRRIEKLVTSTDVRPDLLIEAGFQWTHDLHGAFEHWYNSDPDGQFV